MTNRRVKLELTTFDKVFEMLGWISMLALWILTVANYADLPGTIPTHYNLTGEADGFGDKANIMALPVVATILFVGMTILNRHPHFLNYPASITADNAVIHYIRATRLVRFLKLAIVVIFGLLV